MTECEASVSSLIIRLKAGEDLVLEDSVDCAEWVVRASELTDGDTSSELDERLARRASSWAALDDIPKIEA
jgi:hypothetical protein